MSNLNQSGLFSGITSGLSSTYALFANASSSGVTESSIAKIMSDSSFTSKLNPTFASYILQNFTKLDKNSDGKIGANEMNNINNMISTQGLTSSQLSQLGAAAGLSQESLEQVLSHFTQIDANGDGKVTSNEISAYNIKSAEEKKRTEFANRAAGDMSIYYGSDSTADSSSLLDFKYMNTSSNTNTTKS